MKRAIENILGIIIILLLSNCNKKPTAEFIADKSEYLPGETVKLINKSSSAKTFKWTFPDGQTSSSKDASFQIPANTPDGPISFQLIAYSNRGNKTSEAVKNVTINSGSGSIMFWKSCCSNITVSISKVNEPSTTQNGIVSITSTSEPACGSGGNATFYVTNGTYNYFAQSSTPNKVYTGTLTVQGGCTKYLCN